MAEVPLLTGELVEKPEETIVFTAARTAFLVYIKDSGEVVISGDINLPIVTEREPTPHEIFNALSTVLKDIVRDETAVQAANVVIAQQMSLMRQAQDMQQNAQIMSRIQPGR